MNLEDFLGEKQVVNLKKVAEKHKWLKTEAQPETPEAQPESMHVLCLACGDEEPPEPGSMHVLCLACGAFNLEGTPCSCKDPCPCKEEQEIEARNLPGAFSVEDTPGPSQPAKGKRDKRRKVVSQAEAPQAEAPQAEAPQAEAPQAEAPQAEVQERLYQAWLHDETFSFGPETEKTEITLEIKGIEIIIEPGISLTLRKNSGKIKIIVK